MTRQQQIQTQRCWLGWALGVPPSQVTDEQVLAWEQLAADIRGHRQTEEQARGVRALAKSSCIVPRSSGPAKPEPKTDAEKFFGPRPQLRGER